MTTTTNEPNFNTTNPQVNAEYLVNGTDTVLICISFDGTNVTWAHVRGSLAKHGFYNGNKNGTTGVRDFNDGTHRIKEAAA